ncbi:hypothetical protein ACH4F6_31575 [Streptomyces sp. NPDC017936]|uniref:hypothetical protein n=1 Tax=Streptomyces sp. NPDC017936 TaxID=3365016 RepID=UPI0037BA41C6
MSLTLVTSPPFDPDAADSAARARLIADWLAADSRGDRIAAARIEWEAEQYDPALADEITALRNTLAAA